ncbi:MAG TPA: O-antigen ligase family protein [Thermoleophilaceae bacterium]
MRPRTLIAAAGAALLLAGPVALAFYSGGFFTEPRLVAALAAWLLVLLLAIAGPAPVPRAFPGWLAVSGLALLTVWSAISISWAPLRGPALESVERLLLYLGALLVGIGVLRDRRALRAVEPAVAAGAAIVIGYGLSGRLLPGLIHLAHSARAGGRLEQPITYWNAEGALAAVGFVLCARIAGDPSRRPVTRALAAAATAPLGAGIYLSYSRGAIAAACVGLVLLVALAAGRAQLRAALVALVTGVVAAACSSAFAGVASLHGSLGDRERDGALMLVILVVLAVVAALVTLGRGGLRDEPLPGGRRLAAVAFAAVGLVAVGLAVGGLQEKVSAADLATAKATRLTTVESNRYEYWRLGARAFADHPFGGLGAGGFRTYWLNHRPIKETVQNVHSLELETAAELGVPGLLALGAMLTGVGLAARRALERERALAVGVTAAAVVWLLHASIDWDWQLPAVTLPAITLAGALIALSERLPARRVERVEPAHGGDHPAHRRGVVAAD